jgi:superfamily II DNA helicase RecQ
MGHNHAVIYTSTREKVVNWARHMRRTGHNSRMPC